jgi:hypothetical protein
LLPSTKIDIWQLALFYYLGAANPWQNVIHIFPVSLLETHVSENWQIVNSRLLEVSIPIGHFL